MSIYSNDNISKIAKLTPRELLHLAKTAKIMAYTVCFPREEDDFVSMHCALFEAIVRAQVNRKGVYMTSFKRGYNYVILRSCFHQNQRFALTTIVNAHFWAF